MAQSMRDFLLELSEEVAGNSLLADVKAAVAQSIEKLDSQEFNIIVVGEATKGKSELVNAMIGVKLLPTAPRPTTLVPHIIKWGPSLRITARWEESDRVRNIAPSDLESFGALAENKGVTITIESPSAFLKDGLVVIDTPGVNDLNQISEDIVFRQLPSADAAIMVIDSRYILTASEAQFLTSFIPKGSVNRLLFALTKIDRLDEDERKESLAWAKEGFSLLELSQPVFPVSSTDKLKGKSDSGIEELCDGIRTMLSAGNKSAILESVLGRLEQNINKSSREITSKIALASETTEDALLRVKRFEESISSKEQQFDEAMQRFFREAESMEESLITDLKLFSLDFQKEIPQSLKNASAEDIRKYLPFFIRDTFSDWIKSQMVEVEKGLKSQLDILIEEIKGGVKELSKTLGTDGLKNLSGVMNDPGVNLEMKNGPSIYDFSVACLGVLGTATMFVNLMAGGIVTAAAAAAAVGFRKFRDEATVERAIETSPQAVEETWKKLEPNVRNHFASYRNKTKKALQTLIDDELSTLKAAAASAMANAKISESAKSDMITTGTDALKTLEGAMKKVQQKRGEVAVTMMAANAR